MRDCAPAAFVAALLQAELLLLLTRQALFYNPILLRKILYTFTCVYIPDTALLQAFSCMHMRGKTPSDKG